MYCKLLLIALAAIFANFAEGSLEHLIVTYRSPPHWPTDDVDGLKVYGIEGNNELTQPGQKAAYNLGKDLAQKYGKDLKLIGEKFGKSQYWSFSTSSLPNQEAALYIGKGLQNIGKPGPHKWTDKEMQEIILEKTNAFTKSLDPKRCPGFFQRINKRLPKLKKTLQKYLKTIGIIMQKYKIQDGKQYLIWIVYETLMKMKATKFPIPADIEPLLKDLEAISKEILYFAGSTETLKKLFGGRLLDDIMADLEAKVTGKPIQIPERFGRDGDKIKASFFAAPQGVVASQVAAFNPKGTTYGGKKLTPDTFYPGQGAVHLVELHNEDGKWKVKVQYRRTDFLVGIYQTAIFPGCKSELCDYEIFKNAVKKLRLSETEQEVECKGKLRI